MVPWCTKPAAFKQDVDLADALGKGVDVGRVANVEPCRLRDPFLGQRGKAFFVDIGGDHGCAFARKCDGAGAADAGGCCRNDRAFALEAV